MEIVKRTLALLALLLILGAPIAAVFYWRHEIQVDRCLDRGSRWDRQRDACEPLPGPAKAP